MDQKMKIQKKRTKEIKNIVIHHVRMTPKAVKRNPDSLPQSMQDMGSSG